MSFLSDLTKRLDQASGTGPPWGDVNPLVVIGLTESLLDLKLNDEQLHAAVRSFARQLAAQVHPDRAVDTVSADRQQQIIEAFDYIDSFDNFHLALADFKTLKAKDRKEVRVLQQALSSVRHQVAGHETQLEQLRVDRQALEDDRRNYLLLKKEEPLVVPELEKKVIFFQQEAARENELLRGARMSAFDWKRRFEGLASYLIQLEPASTPGPLFFNAKWVVVASLCHYPIVGEKPTIKRKVNPNFEQAVELLQTGETKKKVKEIIQAWEAVKRDFGQPDKIETKMLPLGFTLIHLENGIAESSFGYKSASLGGRVIGSVGPADASGFKRRNLGYNLDQREIMQRLNPRLIPGNILISMRSDPVNRATWSFTCPAFVFTSRRFILAAG